jgi:hypothetical protein
VQEFSGVSVRVPSGSFACTVTVAWPVALEVAAEVAVIVILGELGTVLGAMNRPVVASMVPPDADQVTVWFELPLTVAV